jgi:tRNA (mo5U34)-methyltransferase
VKLFGHRAAKSREEVEREMRSLGWWYQHFELPNGVWTGDGNPPAYDPRDRWNAFEPYLPADLSGKTALDVGGNSGFFAIQMMLRGAKRVVLVEPFKEFTDQARFAAEQFGVKLEIVNADVHTYCLTTEERFDYVLFLGLFYHLKYPGLVLDRLAEMTKERFVLQSHSVGPGGDELPELPEAESAIDDPHYPRLAFVEHRYKNDPTNWWVPNHEALPPLVRSAGLKIVARPSAEIIVADPDRQLGKVVYKKLVFPRYGKPGEAVYPEQVRLDAALWRQLNEPSHEG